MVNIPAPLTNNLMIDIHTHILPGVDDGAADWEATLAMARAAVQDGITIVVATPHHANGRYKNPAREVRLLVAEANQKLQEASISLQILAGQEIRMHDSLLESWDQEELLTLADSSYMLIEFPSANVPKHTEELFHELKVMGIVPVIAHPERNAELAGNHDRLAALLEHGALAQVTSHSLLGGFGKAVERTAWSFMKRGLVQFVSSDAHHVERRGFLLQEAYKRVGQRVGKDAELSLKENADFLLQNKAIAVPPSDERTPQRSWRNLFSIFHK
ncbi:CpsB/CapC family capsule biosynthesis tyrosine phosphatase [Paenibacillus sp. HB172176]|uniref:tyrosine-protein phosphatase n=1 Tax=Paenibacillus sp. HB172176 TaxID=2493690 RepID=UPI00143B2C72|nr:CpsB/CapC family capsule biosynthesis tyrosine phosphatase [Paenibacillus sp. HB172176]